MLNKGRITAYQERCPKCHMLQSYNDQEKYCDWCGYDYGKDWETVDVDLESGVILRTVISPQPKEGAA